MTERPDVGKVHAALAAVLADHGVRTAFGVTGDGNMFIVDSFVREHGGRYVATANEAGAVLMAMGYASASGGLGLATVTQGPGLANALGVLISAARERLPVVVLTGDIAVRGHSQNIDQALVVTPTGAAYEQARSAKTAPDDLVRALRRALAERRPVVFALPVGLNFADTDYTPGGKPELVRGQAVPPDPDALDAAAGIIASARRPIVLGGSGATSGTAPEALRRLGDVLGAPLATTLPAKGLFGYDKHDLGVFGSFSTPQAVEAIMASDCVVAVGASLSRLTGGGEGWPYFQGKRIVHCDIDTRSIGGQYPADAPVVADAAAFAAAVTGLLDQAGYAGTGFRDSLAGGQAKAEASPAAGDEPVDPAEAMITLNAVLPASRSVVTDGGRFVRHAVENLSVPSARHFAHAGRGFGAVGNGLPMAIGVGAALRDGPVVAVVGDGSFMLGGLAEFNTAVRHGIDLIVVVCNDGAYGAEYRKLRGHGFDVATSLFDWPDFGPVAESLGGSGFTVRTAADLARLGDVIAARGRPLLIDIKLDPATVPE